MKVSKSILSTAKSKINFEGVVLKFPMLYPTASFRLVITMYTSLMPLFLISMGYLSTTIGVVAGIYGYASLAMSMLAPTLFEYFGKFQLILFSFFIVIVSNILLLGEGELVLVCASQILLGVGIGLFRPCSSSLTIELGAETNTGTSLSLLNMFYILGGSIGPWLGAKVAEAYGFNIAFIFSTLIVAIGIVFITAIWKLYFSDVSIAQRVVKTISFNQFFHALRMERVYLAATLIVTDITCLRFWITLLPVLLLVHGISIEKIGFLISSEMVAYFLLMPFWGRLLDSTKSQVPIFLTVTSPLLLILVPFLIDSIILLWILLVLMGGLNAGAYTAAMVLCAKGNEKNNIGNAMSVLSAASDLGHILGPLMVALVTLIMAEEKFAFYFLPIPLAVCSLILFIKRELFFNHASDDVVS